MARYQFISRHRKFQGKPNWSGWHVDLWQEFVQFFNETEQEQMEIVWQHPNLKEYRNSTGIKALDQQAIIEDRETTKFWVLNWQDMQNPKKSRYRAFLDDPDLVKVLRIMYNVDADYGDKVSPWFYYPKEPIEFNKDLDEYRQTPKSLNALFYRGTKRFSNRGKIIGALQKYAIMSEDGRLPHDAYMRQLAASKVALSLMGWAHACHREIECFGIGTPVIQPPYRNHFAEPLLPHTHYVPAEVERKASPDEIAAAIFNAYQKTIDDEQYLLRIRQNALDWYDRNIRPPQCYAKMKELLGIGSNHDVH